MVEPTDRDKDEQDRLAQEEALRDLELGQEPDPRTFKMETTDFGDPTSAQETTASRPIDGQPVTNAPEEVGPIEASGPIEKTTDLQAEQTLQQKLGEHGNQAGTIASATKQVIQEEEAKERAHTAKNAAMAATITAAAATAAQTQEMLEDMAREQEEIDAQLADLEKDSFFFEFEAEEIMSGFNDEIYLATESQELKDLRLEREESSPTIHIDALQKAMERAENPEEQEAYAASLKQSTSNIEEMLAENRAQRDELIAQKTATSEKLQELTSKEPLSEADKQAVLELKQELENTNKGIAQCKEQQARFSSNQDFIKETKGDIALSTEQKTLINDAANATAKYSKDGVLSPDEQKEVCNKMNEIGSSSLYANREYPQKYAELVANSGAKIETPDGRVLEGQEAADFLMAKAKASQPKPENTEPEIAKPDAAEAIAATGTEKVSGETAVGDKADEWSGTDSMKLETSEEYQAAIADVHSRIESGEITREELDQMLAKSDASPELKSQVEKALEREGVNIVEPENTNTPGIKGVAANELGEENAEIAADVTKAATLTAAPSLALLGGQSIKQNIEVQGAPTKVASGINNAGQSFADSDAFKMYNQEGVTASYDEPVNNGAEFAPNDLGETMYAAATNKDDGTGSGSGGGATLDQEAALQLAAEQAEAARLRIAQQNELSRPDLDAPENKMV